MSKNRNEAHGLKTLSELVNSFETSSMYPKKDCKMLTIDLHTHTLFSKCGIHTHLELLTRAKELGIKALAITDHGPILESTIPPTFYDRLFDPLDGIRLIKGMECNICDKDGTIDLPLEKLPFLEIILCGLHPNLENNLGIKENTDMLIAAIKKYPCIDIITHPNDAVYPVDFNSLAPVAKEHGVAIEINNSKTLLQRIDDATTCRLIRACKSHNCPIVICSDTHAINELGRDESVRPFIEKEYFPEELIINNNIERAFAFIEVRKKNKKYNDFI